MSNEFVLDPNLVNELFSYVPFKNIDPNLPAQTFDENATFEGGKVKDSKDGLQTIVELSFRVTDGSPNGNDGVLFKTDLWLNKAVCSGSVRPKDVEDREWQGTQSGLRNLFNLMRVLGVTTKNPVTALTDGSVTTGGIAKVTVNIYKATQGDRAGQYKWSIRRIAKVA